MAMLAGCGEPQVQVWVAGEMTALTDRTARSADPMLLEPGGGAITLSAAGNETTCFQLVLDAGNLSVGDIRVSWSDLTGPMTIEAGQVRAFRCLPVDAPVPPPWHIRLPNRPGRARVIYDKLQPLGNPKDAGPFRLGPRKRLVLWFDLSVPRDALAGQYEGTLTVAAAGSRIWDKQLALEVYDFVLPDAQPIVVVGGFDHADLFRQFIRRGGRPFVPVRLDPTTPLVRRGLTIMRQMMQLAHNHRLDLFDKRIRPVLKRDRFGQVRIDWSDYDAIVSAYLDGTAYADRIGGPAWPAPVQAGWPDPAYYGGSSSRRYRQTVQEALNLSREHFRQAPTGKKMFFWPWRQGPDGPGYQRHLALARLGRRIDPEIPIMSSLPPQPPELTGWSVPPDFDKLTDIYAGPGEFFDPSLPAKTTRLDNSLAGVWITPGNPPYAPEMDLLATPADVRALPWLAMRFGCTGVFIPQVLNWADTEGGSASAGLFYPGPDEKVLGSVRLKRLRRGLQDAAYLWLLQQHQAETARRWVLEAMVRYAGLGAAGDNYLDARLHGWVQDGRAWELARRVLAAEVTKAIKADPLTERRELANKLNWRQLRELTQTVRVEQVRSRIVDVDPTGRATATIMLELYNERTWQVDVTAELSQLPEGFVAEPALAMIPDMPPGARRTLRLSANCPYIPAAPKAKLPLAVKLTTDRQARIFNSAISLVISGPAADKPVIDGSLDDWPLRAGNAAGDFVLLGAQPHQQPEKAGRQSLAFVMHDDRNIYFGIRCDEPDLTAMSAKPSNVLSCRQLMLYGEDMVEILLDPGNAAATTADLYHIVIKPNGVMLTERGVSSSPPLGPAEPWPVAAKLAIGKADGGWVVELALPREAFGSAGKERVWGINFMRFATQDAASSSWAAATRHYYDPRDLGTMVLGALRPEGATLRRAAR